MWLVALTFAFSPATIATSNAEDIPPGTYAPIHDENMNGKLHELVGAPEGYYFSNDVKAGRGTPSRTMGQFLNSTLSLHY
jgi:uncharacterized protein (DUF2141 family)